ncbi:MAG: sigma-54-dependent Fis family transcriptional regulator [Halobacteriovoraceae bacterium]|jgi:Nif-specific regulatory protein|nr:sigma-54-dependent Fis family transcriptional regulator [Halobacteriovoraceae bacterium]MBT5092736.1 sigma-54-dependent Fis family transcriptional regulator [Halobacteriovoraceae bacterium]
MTSPQALSPSKLEQLTSLLLTTLDERIFFSHLGKFLLKDMNCDNVLIYEVKDDSTVQLTSKNGKAVKSSKKAAKNPGPAGHVLRTKRSYFSNNCARDPLFAEGAIADGIQAELVVPVAEEGIIMATLHFQSLSDIRAFSREDITHILNTLQALKKPLTNMKMYLAAKHLNEALLKKVTEKELELEASKLGHQVSDNYKIKEKEIIGKSESMKRILSLVDRIAEAGVNSLITGENGTGKEMIARRIHCRSPRQEMAFISLDCSTLDEQQLEIELFGEECGIDRTRIGLVEKADRGTLFLNNISHMGMGLQAKLSRFLSEKMAFRVNGTIPFRSEVRVIAASSVELETAEEKLLRENLLYSLNTMSLRVPALRERHEDVETLSFHFLNLNKIGDSQKALSPCVVKALKEYSWPGNVRELQNVMERAYILAEGRIIEKEHLADSITNAQIEEAASNDSVIVFSEMTLCELERKHICLTLEHLGGNKTKTAKNLGITVKTLYNKLHSYGMIAPKEA